LLDLQNIVQVYKQGQAEVTVFDDLNLNVKQGETIGIIGPSGSGKSTLLNIIGLLEKPYSGKINISGTNCSDMNNEEKVNFRKNNIGFIFQNNQLLEDFVVEENVALPMILAGHSYKKSIKRAREFLEILGIVERRNFKPGLLSGGEQQRVAIARALIKDPTILLADEPTGSLDLLNTSLVFNLMIKLAKEKNTITILATHNLNLINKINKSYKILDGNLIEYTKK